LSQGMLANSWRDSARARESKGRADDRAGAFIAGSFATNSGKTSRAQTLRLSSERQHGVK
jgi:hypothetical protein